MSRSPCALAVLALSAIGCRQTVLFDDGPDGGSGPDASSPFCPGGEARRLNFRIESPEVIVAVDRSTSMNTSFGETTRVAAARDVVRSAVERYQTVVRFGYVDFPGRPCGDGQSCCVGDLTPPTASLEAFDTALRACASSGPSCAASAQRPIAAALDAAHDTFERLGAGDRRAVLLLTDGPPSCGGSPCEDALLETATLARDDVSTHVVTVGTGTTSDCLRAIAQVGLTEARPATSLESLQAAVAELAGDIARTACEIDVSSTPDSGEHVALLHAGVPVPHDDRNGWSFYDGSMLRIALNGSACQLLLEQGPEGFDLRACRPAP